MVPWFNARGVLFVVSNGVVFWHLLMGYCGLFRGYRKFFCRRRGGCLFSFYIQ